MLTKLLQTLVEMLGLEVKPFKEQVQNVIDMVKQLKDENTELKIKVEALESLSNNLEQSGENSY